MQYSFNPQLLSLTPSASIALMDKARAKVNRDADEMADFLLREAGVVTVPGGAYGENSRDCIRMCFAADPADLENAALRMENALRGE